MKLLSGLILAFVVAVISAEKMRFDNHKVYILNIYNKEQMNVLRQLETTPNGEYTFLDSPRVGYFIDVVVPPQKLYEFGGILKNFNIVHELKIENFQKQIDAEIPAIKPTAFGWTAYNNYTEMYDWLDGSKNIHQYYQVLLSEKYIKAEQFVALNYHTKNNIHAREWITSATATWFINELLTSTDPYIVDLAQNIDWYIIPIFNVDGFHYTHTVNRLWCKSRQNHATICIGTDANRNYDFNWMVNGGASSDPCSDFYADANRNFDFNWMVNDGASSDPCSEVYAGPNPFSEPETAALRDFLEPIGSKINMYLSFHSQGQFILLPYVHSLDPSEHHDLLTDVGNAGAEGFAKLNNTIYTVGSTAAVMYFASGISVDWTFNAFNIPLAYTFEFIGLGYGHVLPPEHILRNCYETRDGIIAIVARARELGYMNVRP